MYSWGLVSTTLHFIWLRFSVMVSISFLDLELRLHLPVDIMTNVYVLLDSMLVE